MAEKFPHTNEVIVKDLRKRMNVFQQSKELYLGKDDWLLFKLQLTNLADSDITAELASEVVSILSPLPDLLKGAILSADLERQDVLELAQAYINRFTCRSVKVVSLDPPATPVE